MNLINFSFEMFYIILESAPENEKYFDFKMENYKNNVFTTKEIVIYILFYPNVYYSINVLKIIRS